MAWKKKLGMDVMTSLPTGVATWSRISSFVKRLIKAYQFEFYEFEALEVESVVLNGKINRGTITGTFVRPEGDSPGAVLPLIPNITQVPVVGEHVLVLEINGQHYYTGVINYNSSVNENAIPTEPNTKLGNSFQRRNVRKININEGSIVFEGRYGNSIHFDRGGDFSPQILLRTNKDFSGQTGDEFTREDIDTDDASIYLVSDGLSSIKFDGEQIVGKKVLIKSNGIFISGDDVRLGSSVETKIEPIVLGNKLKELLDGVFTGTITQNNTTIVANTAKLATLAAIQPPTPQTVDEIKSLGEQNVELTKINIKLQSSITTSIYLSKTVKTA